MTPGTGIRLKGVTFNNPALPKLVNYKDAIAANAACVGAWRFDVDSLIEEDSSGINRILSWKDGGPALAFAAGSAGKATRVYSDLLNGKVANFPGACHYQAEGGFTWNPKAAYTLLVVFKIDSWANDTAIFGRTSAGTSAEAARIGTANLAGDNSLLVRSVRGTEFPRIGVSDPTQFVVAFGSYPATPDDYNPYIQLGALPAVKGTSTATTDPVTATAVPLCLGDSGARPFAGQVDFAALFNTDLINSGGSLRAVLDQYLALRTAGV